MTTKTDVAYEQFHRLIPGADLGAQNQVTIDFKSVAMTKIVTKTKEKKQRRKNQALKKSLEENSTENAKKKQEEKALSSWRF